MSKWSILTDGFVKNNPTFVLVLGMCPTLATTTSAMNGLEMGLATLFVLVLSNIVISLLAPVVPDKVHIPVYIVVIATFVTVLQFIMQAYTPDAYKTLGLFIPLIVVNCIVLGRAEAFANKHGVLESLLDGVGVGLGFTVSLTVIGIVREILGSGSVFGWKFIPGRSAMAKTTFRIGGVHPDDAKVSRGCAIEVLPLPQTVYISMAQHLGAPAKPIVAVGDSVKAGQLIAEAGGFISANVHSSVSGKVKSIAPRKDIAGNNVMHVEITVEGDEWAEGIDLSDTLVTEIPEDKAFILDRIKTNGVVGLGGATFPTHVKLNPAPGSVAECLIINGAECEPYLTSDFRIMLERPKEIVIGAALMQKALGGCRCVIGIEENKPEAIESMSKAVAELGYKGIEVLSLKKKYPQGGEKQLIDAVMRRQVKSGGLPISVGAVVRSSRRTSGSS